MNDGQEAEQELRVAAVFAERSNRIGSLRQERPLISNIRTILGSGTGA